MKNFFSIIISFWLIINLPIYSQVGVEWLKTFGDINDDEGYSVQQTSDGGYIIAGHTLSYGAGSADIWLIKTDNNGNTVWSKTFGGPGPEYAGSVREISDNGFIIAGNTFSYGAGGGDVFLIRTNSAGDTTWMKTYGGPDGDGGTYAEQTSDGGFVVFGTTNSYGAGNTDYWMIKTDSNGDTTWTKTFGGIYNDVVFYGQQTSDGGYVLSGYTQPSGFNNSDFWLVKTDADGNTTWTKRYGGAFNELPYSALQTSDGGYIMAGYTYSFGPSGVNVWVLKTDSNGDSLWAKTYGGVGGEAGQSIIQTSDGGYMICGYSSSYSTQGDADVYLIKTNSNGDSLWTSTFGGTTSEIGFSIDQTSDDGYIVCGYVESATTYDKDILLARLGIGSSVIENSLIPVVRMFELKQNFPNPFNPTTKITFTISDLPAGRQGLIFTSLKVYDVLGNEIATLVNAEKPAGTYEIEFDASNLPSGVYFYRIQAGSFSDTKKLLLIR